MAAFTATFITLLPFLLPGATIDAHNIISTLNKFPEFSTFNQYLTITHLSDDPPPNNHTPRDDINNRQIITMCNAGMSDLLSKHLSVYAMKNVSSLHVLLDQITNGTTLAATRFQTTGTASGSSGFVNVTNLRGSKVGFGCKNSGKTYAMFVESLHEIPYNIS